MAVDKKPEVRFLPEELYPMESHHKIEIEAALALRSAAGSQKLAQAAGLARVVFVCFTNRTGSNLLTDIVHQAGCGVRIAAEDFNSTTVLQTARDKGCSSFDEYLAFIIEQTTRNATCFLKIGASQLLWLSKRGFIADFMPNSRYIFVRRRDKIAQAVSLYVLNNTGEYLKSVGKRPRSRPNFDRDAIAQELMWIVDNEKLFAYFFALHSLPFLEVWYEDFVRSPRDCMVEIAGHCGLAARSWLDLDNIRLDKAQVQRQRSGLKQSFYTRLKRDFAFAAPVPERSSLPPSSGAQNTWLARMLESKRKSSTPTA
jgi:LPS sulfotransferase NodH